MKKYLFGLLLLASCRVQSIPQQKITQSPLNHHFGFLFIDTENGDTLLSNNSEKYFIPASTTKLFTFYASLLLLPNELPTIHYVETKDSLVFWGTGNPSLLRPDFGTNQTLDFLKSKANKHLVFSDANFDANSYGKGWMWDDYEDAYQVEVSSLPLYGNLVHFTEKDVQPPFFKSNIENKPSFDSKVNREFTTNSFHVPNQQVGLCQNVPFKTSGKLTAQLLSDTLHLTVGFKNIPMPNEVESISFAERDSLIKSMLYLSDNMIAEQLLLMTSGNKLSVITAIENILSNQLADIPQKPRWVDGSGLSRYNLFTPQDMVYLLQNMKVKYGLKTIKSYLPNNGNEGTMKSFAMNEDNFLWAKSGSMSGVYNMAGFLKTKSNRTLTFAVMNNNFTKPVSEVRKEMEELLLKILNEY
jgi:D-alanyl-D-alanine carboxypeptidase/D-alanyl-D-alanine-endopeptidase (penicillin-binding protein 4)